MRSSSPALAWLVVLAACGSPPPPAAPADMPLPPTRDEQMGRHADPGDEQVHVYSVEPKTGPATGGNVVVIRGANFRFAQTAHVLFNKSEGQVTRMIDDEIAVIAPPGTAGQEVQVTVILDPGQNQIPLPGAYVYAP